MKTAIFQGSLQNIGGAERVCLILARELGADIYTTSINKDKVREMGFEPENIHSIGKITQKKFKRQQEMLSLFRKIKLQNYDFHIIAGEWALTAAKKHKPNMLYAHSLMREAWDLYPHLRRTYFKGVSQILGGLREEYRGAHKKVSTVKDWQYSIKSNLGNIRDRFNEARKVLLFDSWASRNRKITKKYLKYTNLVLCNSKNTQNKIKEYTGRDATILYPPVDTKKYFYHTNGNYWLSVNRLHQNKRVELQLEAFRRLPQEKLIIVGDPENTKESLNYATTLKKIKPKNVQILSADDERLRLLYSRCKGFLTTSLDEDFGLTAVEAMASGKPVIAPNEGGYQESVIHEGTGKLIDQINQEKIVSSIKTVGENPKKYREACLHQASKFDTKIFMDKLRKEMTT